MPSSSPSIGASGASSSAGDFATPLLLSPDLAADRRLSNAGSQASSAGTGPSPRPDAPRAKNDASEHVVMGGCSAPRHAVGALASSAASSAAATPATSSPRAPSAASTASRAAPPPMQAPSRAAAALGAIDRLLAPRPSTAAAAPLAALGLGAPGVFVALADVPQYDRTHVPGCLCRPALAGGACCPGSAGSMTLQQLGGGHVHAHGGLTPLGVASAGLGVAGAIFGRQVVEGARDAQRHLAAVDAAAAEQQLDAGLWRAKLSAHPELPHARARAEAELAQASGMRRDLAAATREQRFTQAVPGNLQVVASLAGLATGLNHMAGGALGMAGGALLAATSSALFALYGLCMATKNFAEWRADRRVNLAPGTLPGPYAEALRAHLKERLRHAGRTALAWAGVATAGLLGAAVTLGYIVLPQAWIFTGLLSLGAGIAAMVSNSCSRWAPHLPISPHMQREAIATAEQRGALLAQLGRQQRAIEAAVAAMGQDLRGTTRVRARLEAALQPQCGPKAFQVLAGAVAARTSDSATPELVRKHDQHAQLTAVIAYLREERSMLAGRLEAARAQAHAQAEELRGRVQATCSKRRAAMARGTQAEAVLAEGARRLERDAWGVEAGEQQLAALEALLAACHALEPDAGRLSAAAGQAPTPAQRQWVQVRLGVLQLGGMMRDALSTAFIEAHSGWFSTRRGGAIWPINSLCVLPEHMDALTEAVAGPLEAGFIHAFFNPRRIEAEMDYLLDVELRGRRGALAPAVARADVAGPATVAGAPPQDAAAAGAVGAAAAPSCARPEGPAAGDAFVPPPVNTGTCCGS